MINAMDYKVKLLNKQWLTHDVTKLQFERPEGFEFQPGEAIEMKVNGKEPSPFTLTGLPSANYLEFMIKIYPDHHGTTEQISTLNIGDHVKITAPFVTYKDDGPGVFIAGGAGITPFIAILRSKVAQGAISNNRLFFANKKRKDIFMEEELNNILGDNYRNVLSKDEDDPEYYGRIDKAFLKSHISNFNQSFYLCGPEGFAEDIKQYLNELGATVEQVKLSE